MRKFLLLTILLTSCQNPGPGNTNTNSNSNIVNIFGPTDSSTPDGCNAVVRVNINAPDSLLVGSSVRLDATPKDSNGQPRDPVKCDEKSGVVWTNNSDICSLSNPNTFIPNVTGVKAGTCVVSATVESVTGTASFLVK